MLMKIRTSELSLYMSRPDELILSWISLTTMGFAQKFNKFFGYNREEEQRRLAELRALTTEEKADRFADLIDADDFVPSKTALFFGQFWDTFRKPPRQRKYVQKLDLNIL
jgi:ACS family pantothenate transporter-like MFS transporter